MQNILNISSNNPTTEMRTAIKPYPIAVAPDSGCKNFLIIYHSLKMIPKLKIDKNISSQYEKIY
ncbi:hypothetical protein AYJ09_00545 [Candidatus Liberibacter solanacearum]|nr:hypothetical protein AYJ09_00545 [Candidatus Liberibacter solanacearum]